ncbi:proteasome maturation protein [Oratosquilla oratoria]|uniref:proteasome maturation protein n=1 Tax=Oratosquilla oratoria TaxID=337810 RepID=UPI003F76C431
MFHRKLQLKSTTVTRRNCKQSSAPRDESHNIKDVPLFLLFVFKERNGKMALPLRVADSKIAVAVESDYGTEVGLVRRAPLKVTQHPLEASEKTYQERYDKRRMTSAAQTFGIGFTLHLKHERAAVSVPTIGHMPVLPRSNAHYQALTGKDLDIGFEDTLATDLEFSRTPHTVMEKQYERPLFK